MWHYPEYKKYLQYANFSKFMYVSPFIFGFVFQITQKWKFCHHFLILMSLPEPYDIFSYE